MKKNFTVTTRRLSILISLMTAQVNVWALETTNSVHHTGSFLMQPWPWIPLIVTAIILLAGPFNYKRDFKVIMKKKTNDKKKVANWKTGRFEAPLPDSNRIRYNKSFTQKNKRMSIISQALVFDTEHQASK
jgi:hypothetical protein